ncbi:MAG: hypothetical protein KGH73_06355, partial [Xanthomonadaceae bacterium]|nr:hypothetical protein [Xanthomonadaceae bacterium]
MTLRFGKLQSEQLDCAALAADRERQINFRPTAAAHLRTERRAGKFMQKLTTSTAMDPSQSAASSGALTRRPQWRALQEHAGALGRSHLRELFAADPARGERLRA